jgi:hypothetical protein
MAAQAANPRPPLNYNETNPFGSHYRRTILYRLDSGTGADGTAHLQRASFRQHQQRFG